MLRMICAVGMAACLFAQETAHTRDYQVRRRSGEHVIEVSINRNPPVIGENLTRIKVLDGRGNCVRGAEVKVNYSMPPMPGMPPMNYTVRADASGDGYLAVMNLIMRGPWNIVITVRDRAKLGRVIFPIDVR
ncbi:MAG TPA: FixH family protein [Deltaproteobacteria bacterium]|jgi:hypothetical protein|nr:FixH family protein [Deltaproteobacteria bacterium]HQI02841.1 FixH family protein [Deltaproteobacteria bacterium]